MSIIFKALHFTLFSFIQLTCAQVEDGQSYTVNYVSSPDSHVPVKIFFHDQTL